MLTKSQRLISIFGGWLALVITVLMLFNSLNFDYFFIMGFIGFLVLVEISGPFTLKPKWRSRMDLVIIVGVLIFALILAGEILKILHITIPV